MNHPLSPKQLGAIREKDKQSMGVKPIGMQLPKPPRPIRPKRKYYGVTP